jgi:hypothetical protein
MILSKTKTDIYFLPSAQTAIRWAVGCGFNVTKNGKSQVAKREDMPDVHFELRSFDGRLYYWHRVGPMIAYNS